MATTRIMVLGEKETFLIRVLTKKLNDAGYDAFFVGPDINDINSNWEGTAILTCYMDNEDGIPDDVLRFIGDKMRDHEIKSIVIGEKDCVKTFIDNMPPTVIYKSFYRPLDNEEYMKTVKELSNKYINEEFKKSILIVDDDANYLNLVRGWLKETYKVSMVTSGLQAMKWLGQNKADLILLDFEMPVLTGPKVLEMLRNEPETASIPVIFLTGKSDKASVMEVVALKPEGYFLKTIERAELLENLGDFFMKRK